ncbi:MAG: ATP-binding protein [Candidatus Nanopelagicales bacterium]
MQGRTARLRGRLSTQVFLLLLVILLVSGGVGFAVTSQRIRGELDHQAAVKSLDIARSVAATPEITAAFDSPSPASIIDPLVETIRRSTGAAFIVVANREGIRYSHPNPRLIGTSLLHDPGENPQAVLAGHPFLGVQSGSLGRSMRAKLPLRNTQGQIIGLVSVGVLERRVSAEMGQELSTFALPPLLALLLGLIGAVMLARRVKSQTFGLEPAEIGALLEQREAMLHGVREGAITVTSAGMVTLINDEARRLLDIDGDAVGRELATLLPEGRIREVLTSAAEARDEVIVLGSLVLLVSRIPVFVRAREIGAIITLRDRTELESLGRELDDTRAFADGLRAQEHEFSNRLHVIGGLIELGRYAEAVRYIDLQSKLHQDLAATLIGHKGDPLISGLLIGKVAVASERGVDLRISSNTEFPEALADPDAVVTILGNLIDNAIDAAATSAQAIVEVSLNVVADQLILRVHDSGPGVDPEVAEAMFTDGFSTKPPRPGVRRRGLGMALVRMQVDALGASISVENVDGALITVSIPMHLPEQAPAAPAAELQS